MPKNKVAYYIIVVPGKLEHSCHEILKLHSRLPSIGANIYSVSRMLEHPYRETDICGWYLRVRLSCSDPDDIEHALKAMKDEGVISSFSKLNRKKASEGIEEIP
jgi:hypothetical protein